MPLIVQFLINNRRVCLEHEEKKRGQHFSQLLLEGRRRLLNLHIPIKVWSFVYTLN